MIRFTCPGCQSKLSAKEKLAGESRRCPKCGLDVQVPEPEADSEGLGTTPEPTESTGESLQAGAAEEALPRAQGMTKLTRGNRYLICDRASVFAVWSDGSGWMVKTNAGLVSAARNPELLPAEGTFTLIELTMKRGDEGLLLTDVHCNKLAVRWALTALEQDEHKILTKVEGPGSLNRDQKTAVLRFVKEQFMPEVWEGSQNVREFLTNADYMSAGTE